LAAISRRRRGLKDNIAAVSGWLTAELPPRCAAESNDIEPV
jgi:hypothetical protein